MIFVPVGVKKSVNLKFWNYFLILSLSTTNKKEFYISSILEDMI